MSAFEAKMHKIQFPQGFRSRPRWRSLQRSPDPLAGFMGEATSKGREGKEGRKTKTEGGKGGGQPSNFLA